MSEAEVISTEDLRNRMFEVLKKRGLIDVLKVSQDTIVPCIALKTRHSASTSILANISPSRYVAIAAQPVPRLHIRPIVHN